MAILTQVEVEDKLRGQDLNTWLQLWQAEQGPAKLGSLKLMAAAIPFPDDKNLRVLDLCCGPRRCWSHYLFQIPECTH
jgi:hypothetical protein